MYRRSASFRLALLVAAASFLWLSCVAGGHLHERAAGSLKTECQLCSVGQVRSDAIDSTPALVGLILLAWLVAQSPAAALSRPATILPPSRAPPAH